MKIIAVAMKKGGDGKTTTTVNMAILLAQKNYRVLVVDLDPQGNASMTLSGGKTNNELTSADIFDSKIPMQQLLSTSPHNDMISIIAADSELEIAAQQLLNKLHREKILARRLKELEGDFDVVLIDCPPASSQATVNALYACDVLLVPTEAVSYSVKGAGEIISALREVQEHDETNIYILRTKVDGREKAINKRLEDEIKDSPVGHALLDSFIARDTAVKHSIIADKPIVLRSKGAIASQHYKNAVNEIISKEGM